MKFQAPHRAPECALEPGWIDYNGHLNMAYYHVLFDRGIDHLFDMIGCGANYRDQRDMSFYTLEVHVCYLRELAKNAQVSVTTQLLAHDQKKIHLFQELIHVDGWTAATSESLHLHVDMSGPSAAVMPEDIISNFAALSQAHQELGVPENAGRSVSLSKKRS